MYSQLCYIFHQFKFLIEIVNLHHEMFSHFEIGSRLGHGFGHFLAYHTSPFCIKSFNNCVSVQSCLKIIFTSPKLVQVCQISPHLTLSFLFIGAFTQSVLRARVGCQCNKKCFFQYKNDHFMPRNLPWCERYYLRPQQMLCPVHSLF